MSGTVIALLVLTGGTIPGLDELCGEVKVVSPADREADDRFGISTAVSGDYAIIGAHFDDDRGDNAGASYIYMLDGATWVEQQKLLASDGELLDDFGASVSIGGDYAVVGAPGPTSSGSRTGAVYVYHREGTIWVEQAQLAPNDPAVDSNFGAAVSISGDVILVGAPGLDSPAINAGAAYVFERSGSSWTQDAKLTAGADASVGDSFGISVSIDGSSAVVGAYSEDNDGGGCGENCNYGAAYVFHYDGADWVQEAKLTAADATQGDRFGNAVAVHGAVAVIGASRDDHAGAFAGSAYIYDRIGMSWLPDVKLAASDAAAGSGFGESVAIHGDWILVGAYTAEAAYLFRLTGTTWDERASLYATDGRDDDEFGVSVAIGPERALVGAHQDEEFAESNNFGSVYAFVLAECINPIPTISTWGVVVMVLLVLTIGTLAFRTSYRPAA